MVIDHPLNTFEFRLVVNELKVTPCALASHLLLVPSFNVPFSPPVKTSDPDVFVAAVALVLNRPTNVVTRSTIALTRRNRAPALLFRAKFDGSFISFTLQFKVRKQ
jgi:hypothetical protein